MKSTAKKLLAVLLSGTMAASAGALSIPAFAATQKAGPAIVEEVNETSAVADSVNALNWKLYDKMAGSDNLFYSAYSIDSVLAMLDAGAKGNTKKQMDTVLNIKNIDTFLNQYQTYRGTNTSENCKLNTANGIFVNSNLLGSNDVNKSYINKMEKTMGAKVKAEPFNNKTKAEIKQFVNRATEGFMPDYESILTPDNAMDLINAVYFDGKWEVPFTEDNTYKETFHGKSSSDKVDMMHLSDKYFRYVEDAKFKAIELPYKDGTIVMDIILPAGENTKNDVADTWKKTSAKDRDAFLKTLDDSYRTKIHRLTIPKFEYDKTTETLPSVLKSLGMADAFSNKADFTGIAPGLAIDNINHRAKIQVDENGTKAAAVTEATMRLTSAAPMPEVYINFIADHPFLYLIRDRSNGMVLFTGVMNNLK